MRTCVTPRVSHRTITNKMSAKNKHATKGLSSIVMGSLLLIFGLGLGFMLFDESHYNNPPSDRLREMTTGPQIGTKDVSDKSSGATVPLPHPPKRAGTSNWKLGL